MLFIKVLKKSKSNIKQTGKTLIFFQRIDVTNKVISFSLNWRIPIAVS